MEITRETDYAVRCVLHLAVSPDRVAMMGEIAREREIPRSFLAKILQKLTRAGVVRSYRGIRGGFRLAREPAEISLLEVVEAIEGPVSLNRCTAAGRGCTLSGSCVVHPVWIRVSEQVSRALARHDFAGLVSSERRGKARAGTRRAAGEEGRNG